MYVCMCRFVNGERAGNPMQSSLVWSKWIKIMIFCKKVPKNSVFEYHDYGSPDFGGVGHPKTKVSTTFTPVLKSLGNKLSD